MRTLLLCILCTVASLAAGEYSGSEIHEDLAGLRFDVEKARSPMLLHMLPEAVADGAMCLDGSPTGYYFAKASTTADQNNWQIYFEGGGWCYSEADCWGRSKGTLGSSKNWPANMSSGGILDDDCSVNLDFCNYNRVLLAYCDGNSFSGDRADPIYYEDDPLYFRGKRNLDATFKSLIKDFNFGQAEKVLLTGCSAGGLATYINTDYVTKFLPTTVKKFKSIPISGYFLHVDTVEHKPVYGTEIKAIYTMSNASLNAACVAAWPASEQWRCNFAQESYRYTTSPMFVLNSFYDSWQTGCIFSPEFVPPWSTNNGACNAVVNWGNCTREPEKYCTNTQMGPLNAFAQSMTRLMQTTPTYSKDGNGAWVGSCHSHCEAQDSRMWQKTLINGVSMAKAVSDWWNADTLEPAAVHSFSDCYWHDKSQPRTCNPTC